MGFETYEEMEAFADSLEQSDLEAHDAAVYRVRTAVSVGCGVCGATGLPVVGHADVCGRPHKTENTSWLLGLLAKGSQTDALLLELELRGVAVWRCDGCDRWLADTHTAHINHSADCEANGS